MKANQHTIGWHALSLQRAWGFNRTHHALRRASGRATQASGRATQASGRATQASGRATRSAGFTLLEVILAIAVLAISLTAILEAMRNAYRNADAAAVESEALIYAESILAELATGIRPATAVQGAPLELGDERDGRDEQWQYSIAIEPTMQDEIVLARVLVQSVRENMDKAPKVEVAQWFLNPELVPSTSGSSTGSNLSPGGSSSVTGSGQ